MDLEQIIQRITIFRPNLPIKIILIGIYFAVAAVLFHYVKKDGQYDFDQVMYAACTFDEKNIGPETLKQKTYDAVLADLGPQKLAQFTDPRNYYRKNIFDSGDNLRAQLPFYKLKLLYVSLLKLGYAAGFSPFRFSTIINLTGFVFASLLLFVFLTRRLNFLKGWLAAILITMMPAVAGVAKLNSPDLLACLACTCAVFALISAPPYRQISIPLFMLLVFIRPENIVLPVMISVLGIVFKPRQFPVPFLLALGGLSLMSYFILTTIVQPYPWSLLFRHSFLGFIPDIQNRLPGLTLQEYFVSLKWILRTTSFSDYSMICFLSCITLILAAKKNLPIFMLTCALLSSIIIRVLLFPDLSSRYFAGPFVVSAVLLLLVIFPERSTVPGPPKVIEEGEHEILT